MQVQRQIIDVADTRVVLELPASFVNRRVEVIALTVDEEQPPRPARRAPSPAIFGKGRVDSPTAGSCSFSCDLPVELIDARAQCQHCGMVRFHLGALLLVLRLQLGT